MLYATLGTVIVVISAVFSFAFANRKTDQQPKQIKILLFGLYFWGFAFLQLTIGALLYYGFYK